MVSRSLLPRNRTAFETAFSEATADFFSVPVTLLDTLWNPMTVPPSALPHLSAALGVDLYRPDWPLLKKRNVAAASPRLHRLKGTIPGLAAHLAINDATLVEWRAPPAGVFLAPTPDKEAMEAWYERLPQIRVYTIPDTAPARDEIYWSDGFLRDTAAGSFVFPDLGPTLSPRKATYWRDGVEVPLRVTRLLELEATRTASTVERVEIPRPNGEGLFLGDGFLDDVAAAFFDTDEGPQIVTYALDRSYSATLSAFATTTVSPGLKPLDVRAARVSLSEPAGEELYLGDGGLDGAPYYPGPYDGHLAFDRLCFLDPAIAAPVGPALSFWNLDRYDMDDFRLDILVDVPGTVPAECLVTDGAFLGEGFWFPFDPAPEEAAAQAVRVSKALRDQVNMTLAIYRPRTADDGWPLDGSVQWDEPVPNTL